ncbi:ThiF family adenylyltransferase [Nitrosopumilus adriaticus]|uniref:ThiF family adenylyltransferase n=1 Tax=Nitrosopumilus adriaticus TaxID=1580092 RepID=UPI000696B990|nr:ThiF family adenylyltransferase [Nitrosopumilus adriaticus]
MSLELINRNSDLQQLQNEGYEVEFFNIYLMIHHVPYVNDKKQVAYGTLVSKSSILESSVKPADHTTLWIGDFPCDCKGSRLLKLGDNSVQEKIRDGLVATRMFSQKPKTSSAAYANYHEKMTTYVRMLEGEARVIDPNVTAKTFLPIQPTKEESVFHYLDTASTRAGITLINDKLKQDRIAIVGLGGTGSYILDFMAKTPVGEIHLFDGDKFYNHNAFRSPGAPTYDELLNNTTKVEWFTEIYSRMRRNIIPHPQIIDETNIGDLDSMDFVFYVWIKENQGNYW